MRHEAVPNVLLHGCVSLCWGHAVAKHSLFANAWPLMHWQRLVRNMACIWTTQRDDIGVEVSKRDMPMRRAQDDSGWI